MYNVIISNLPDPNQQKSWESLFSISSRLRVLFVYAKAATSYSAPVQPGTSYRDYVKSSHRLMLGGYRAMRIDESVILIFAAWFR